MHAHLLVHFIEVILLQNFFLGITLSGGHTHLF